MSDVVEPLNEEEKKTLREVAFLMALDRVEVARHTMEMVSHLYQFVGHGRYDNDPKWAAFVAAVERLSSLIPDEEGSLAAALDVVMEDHEYVGVPDYNRLRARANGDRIEEWENGYKFEHPVDVLRRCGGLRNSRIE